MLAYLQARGACGDGPELAANAVGRVRFQIKTVLLRQAARQKNIDCRSRFACLVAGRATRRCGRPQRFKMVGSETDQANGAGLNHGAPRQTRMDGVRGPTVHRIVVANYRTMMSRMRNLPLSETILNCTFLPGFLAVRLPRPWP